MAKVTYTNKDRLYWRIRQIILKESYKPIEAKQWGRWLQERDMPKDWDWADSAALEIMKLL